MKKIKIALIFTVVLFLMISCTSSKAGNNSDSDIQNSQDSSVQKEQKQNLTGWVDTSKKEIELTSGIIQIKVKPNLGSFNINVINQKDKHIPVLSTANEYTSTNLQLKTGRKIYKLISDANVKYSVLKTKNVMTVIYEIENVAEVKANFSFIQSSLESEVDTLKVTYTITNLGTRKDDFALKSIYDTVLGETTQTHFYTSGNNPVKSEVMYRTMQNQKWVVSKNDLAAVQFLFDGGDTTPIEILALANYSTLSKNLWEPDMLSYRAFDTVLSYNNSSIGVIWPSEKLQPKKSMTITHYISFAVDGDEPAGDYYVYGMVKPKKEEAVASIVEKIPQIEEKEQEKEVVIEIENLVSEKKSIPNVEFNVNGIPKEKFTPEYIQKLLDRISELEKDTSVANREEILQLNAELDEILSVLRQ